MELRATTPAGVRKVIVEIEGAGERREVSAEPFEPIDEVRAAGLAADDGHLATAAAGGTALAGGRRAWRVVLDGPRAGLRVRYRFTADDGTATRWHAVVIAGWQADGGRLLGVGSRWVDLLVSDSVSWLAAGNEVLRVRFALRLDPEAHIVGFGERFDQLDQRGRRLDAVVFEQYKGQGQRTYLPMPYAIVTPTATDVGWGFHVRTSRRTWYDVGATDVDRLVVEAQLDPGDPALEIALYDGPPTAVIEQFLADVGRSVLPPDWVFRPWMSGNEWNTQARVVAEVERSIAEGIPAGVVVLEAWSDEATFVAFRHAEYEVHPDGAAHRLADFRFPPDGAWPDPRGLVEWLHERDVRILLWQIPLMKADTGDHAQAAADRATMSARGYGVREADGRPYRNRGWWFPRALLPDWSNADGARWWLEKRRYLVEELGIDGFKTDGGEHAWGDELRYADGRRGDAANNTYPVEYAAAFHQLMGSAGRDGVTFSRAGFTGAGTVPLHWAGDEDSTWAAFQASVTAGLTAGASGVFFWGWDLGGFSGDVPDPELYLRGAAMASLCPVMQYHSEFNHHRQPSRDRTPWNIAERSGDPSVIEVFRRFALLRERLAPYLAEQARVSVATSRPLMRSLLFEWADDSRIWDYPFQYLLGDDLLVAPVVEPRGQGAGGQAWPVFVPSGDWVDAWTGAEVRGPVVLRRVVPIDEIPVFVRAAAWSARRSIFEG